MTPIKRNVLLGLGGVAAASILYWASGKYIKARKEDATRVKTAELFNHLDSLGLLGSYQPVIINGREVRTSGNWSGGSNVIPLRYAPIQKFLKDTFQDRRFKLLDVGANLGYFGLRISEDFPNSSIVMIDAEPTLKRICELNTDRKNVICFQKKINTKGLDDLAKDGRFDVVLCLHVLHHNEHLEQWFSSLRQLGQYVIIETPVVKDQIHQQMAMHWSKKNNSPVYWDTTHKIEKIWTLIHDLKAEPMGTFLRGPSTSHMFRLPPSK